MKSKSGQRKSLSLREVAREAKVSVETARRRLKASGVDPLGKFSWGDVLRAWTGDPSMARTRRATAEAELLELKAARMRGELADMAEVEAAVRGWMLPVRDALIACPDEMAARCNPGDPEHARVQLDEWAMRTLRVMGGAEDPSKEAPDAA